MDSAPTIGCSGPVPAGEYGAGVLLEDTSGRDEILLQGIVVLSDEEAVEFLENLPCNGDPSLSRLQLADDEARIRAFRSQFETNPNYMVDLVFIRRGELLTFFSFQQLASRDQTQQVARRADDKLALVAEELADN